VLQPGPSTYTFDPRRRVVPVYDLSLSLSPDMLTWPGDPPVRVEPRLRISRGDVCNVSELSFGSHTGTHVDPPYHFVEGGMRIDELPLEALMGRTWVCDLGDRRQVTADDLRQSVPADAIRVLLKTSNSALWQNDVREFRRDFVALAVDAAQWIAQRDICLLGIDYLSVEGPGSPGHTVHHTLLEAGVVIVEGLDLSPLHAGWYNFCCLPLKVAGGDGAPARALAIGPLE